VTSIAKIIQNKKKPQKKKIKRKIDFSRQKTVEFARIKNENSSEGFDFS